MLRATILDHGARLVSLAFRTPDGWREQLLTLPRHDAYLEDPYYIGALVGRYANRIRNGRFSIDGKPCQLDRNAFPHHLHGGAAGFDHRKWSLRQEGETALLDLTSEDGEGGYPGRLDVTATVRLSGASLTLEAMCTATAPTHANLTWHPYFTLGEPDVANLTLAVAAGRYVAVDDELIPTGDLPVVDNTPLDLRVPGRLGNVLERSHPLTAGTAGIDHCLVLDQAQDPAAILASGAVSLSVHTDEPGLQVYTAGGMPTPHCAICLEPQHFPDSPNEPSFPPTLLLPGDTRTTRIRYAFSNTGEGP